MPIEVRCRRCGKPFVTMPADVLRGPDGWRYCPSCRPPAASDLPLDPTAAKA